MKNLTFFNKLKMFIWKISLGEPKNCPFCKKELYAHYSNSEFGGYIYSCYTKDCKFNEF